MSHMIQLDCKNPIFGNGKTKVTYGYMDPQYGSAHYGADLVPGTGTEESVIAVEEGEVVTAKTDVNRTLSVNVKQNWNSPDVLGNHVAIRHPNGLISKYCHMKYGSVCVKKGDKVKKGMKIGVIGNTGLSTAAHVHFEIWTKENDPKSRIDPEPYVIGTKPLKDSAATPNPASATPAAPKPAAAENLKSRVLAFDAALRQQPSAASSALARLGAGSTVTVVSAAERRDNASGYVYINITANNKNGWIVKSSLK